jgi:predicted permease
MKMRTTRTWYMRLRGLFRKEQMNGELSEELASHLEMHTADNVRAGMTPEEARRNALIKLGGVEQTKEKYRERGGWPLLESLTQDLRFGLRLLRKNPGFTAIAVLTLALGIGASTAVFSVVNTILLKPLPYANSERIYMPWWKAPPSLTQFTDKWPWSIRDFARFSQGAKTFQYIGAFKSDFFNLSGTGEPDRLDGLRASAGFFSALGVAPELGHTFQQEDDQPGQQHKVLLSDQLWRDRFGADAGILGRWVALNGESYAVVGVMPPGFTFPHAEEMPIALSFPRQIQLWVPLEIPAAPPGGPSDLAVIGRLNPGVTSGQAESELRVYGTRIVQEFPSGKGWYEPTVVPLTRQVVGDTRRPLLLILGAVGVVLLIASSNVASLLITRSLGRQQELTLRSALGAGRGRMTRQLLTESLLLASAGGLAGILLAVVGIHAVKILGPSNIPRLGEVALEPRVLAFTFAITLITGVLFGWMPAISASRGQLAEALREGGHRSGGSAAHPKVRNALLVGQVACALVLVVAAGLLVRTFYHMLSADAGFNPTRVLTFQLTLPSSKYTDIDRMTEVYQKVLQALESLPGVQSAGLVSEVPMGGATDGTSVRIPDHPPANEKEQQFVNYSFASPGYFSAIGTPLLCGRDFLDTDVAGAMPVTIINAAVAKKYWPHGDALGHQLGVKAQKWPTRTIVGIVADIKHNSLREDPDPEMYVPFMQNEIKVWPSMQTMQVALRSKADPAALTATAREALRAVDPDLPLAKVTTLATLVNDSLAQSRFSLFLVASFGGLALLLATIGMYGVISYSVQQRTQEIGVRMALGATRGNVLGMVLALGARLAALGIVLGLLAAWLVTRTMANFLYGVAATDPLTFAAVAALLMSVALLACYLPARRATRVDPMIALRYE